MSEEDEIWTVIDVQNHIDGATTVTAKNRRGHVKTEHYPLGATIRRVPREGELA